MRVEGLARIQGSEGCAATCGRVQGAGYEVQSSGCGVRGSGFRGHGAGCGVSTAILVRKRGKRERQEKVKRVGERFAAAKPTREAMAVSLGDPKP